MVPKFSRRHYRAIAKAMKDCHMTNPIQWARCVNALAQLFEADNPRFSWRKFEEACK
jgi:hypothetical protein